MRGAFFYFWDRGMPVADHLPTRPSVCPWNNLNKKTAITKRKPPHSSTTLSSSALFQGPGYIPIVSNPSHLFPPSALSSL